MPDRPTALVTGASRGIGRAIAQRLAPTHAIVAVARSADDLASLRADIEREGGECRTIELDVTDGAAVRAALGDVQADVLINNAGVGVMKPLLEMEPDEWAAQLDTNVNALYHVTRAVLPGMVKRGRGDVITIGSLAGRNTFAGGTAYTGTKHFVNGWSESLMLEVRDHGVRVSVIMPGSVATHFGGTAPSGEEWKLHGEDIADAVAYLVGMPARAHSSRIEMRPARPKK